MTLPEIATLAEFATIARFKRPYVTELKHNGRLVLTDDGKRVRVAESLELIKATSDPSRSGVARRHAADRLAASQAAAAVPSAQEPTEDEPEWQQDTPYHAHRAEKERWLAAGAKRDYEISMRELLPAREVESAIAQMGNALRKDLERLPDTLAPQLAPMGDEHAIRTFLAENVEQALTEMARRFALMIRSPA